MRTSRASKCKMMADFNDPLLLDTYCPSTNVFIRLGHPVSSFTFWEQRMDYKNEEGGVRQNQSAVILEEAFRRDSSPLCERTTLCLNPHWVQQKPMCHLNLGNLMDVQERHNTNRKIEKGIALGLVFCGR
ncbi:hypothetical protein J6590_016569 [Homalodisca vitripennis]|nr:hypothetical protein J6590_016569 [Homalodisca vitripennis]